MGVLQLKSFKNTIDFHGFYLKDNPNIFIKTKNVRIVNRSSSFRSRVYC